MTAVIRVQHNFKTSYVGTTKMAQQEKVSAPMPEDLSSIPDIHMEELQEN